MISSKLKLYLLESLNPFVNLAYENHLLRSHSENESQDQIILLWKSSPSIVMGKFQNPWVECRVKEIRDRGINLVRRQSGGGCVYHDPGNLNYSFIGPRSHYDKSANAGIIVDALRSLGISAFENQRHDLRVDHEGEDYKISGCAFKEIRNSALHHGTLLMNADLDILNELLRSKFEASTALGVKSVRSNVINLFDISNSLSEEKIKTSIQDSFGKYYKTDVEVLHITEQDICMLPDMISKISDTSSWQHIYGGTPKFSFKLNNIEVISKYARIIQVSNDDKDLLDLVIDKTYYEENILEKDKLSQKQHDFINACHEVLFL
ncbi:lipoyltransferase and lipoate-protein ligase [Halobacteriovorax sp. BALOs_7]|uniref:lipoate--protein ligase family protein n=1 Tax=Halobacteriovorax sp. BALOs_7 TaxID=2109558 RepID=UPI000EB661CD|nr:hypothetical protein [Halobacteriovorax sp. BALOs_7]AYF44676.1 lipoyltransferase and lipoate-protein ligase [Halobacteriovorax sp. BALOs_7]